MNSYYYYTYSRLPMHVGQTRVGKHAGIRVQESHSATKKTTNSLAEVWWKTSGRAQTKADYREGTRSQKLKKDQTLKIGTQAQMVSIAKVKIRSIPWKKKLKRKTQSKSTNDAWVGQRETDSESGNTKKYSRIIVQTDSTLKASGGIIEACLIVRRQRQV